MQLEVILVHNSTYLYILYNLFTLGALSLATHSGKETGECPFWPSLRIFGLRSAHGPGNDEAIGMKHKCQILKANSLHPGPAFTIQYDGGYMTIYDACCRR